ncbi:hypothetical protein DXG03_004397 [Asterophora parasitica]|uniref:Uncharacterized protein n=1 Tax=Asterophora parasitica TaxID=117018 RepID=A0A9P7G6K4_9AGAR|nr:hypothetical protein DXG03_004397 [Asterophora parasitica]
MIQREIAGHIALQGLDLTYEVLGHVARSDGEIIGLMTESELAGRPVQYRDRAKVYEALARVERRGLVFCGAQNYSNIHILDSGKVRLTNLASIWCFPNPTTREEQGARHHWDVMESVFVALRARARKGVWHTLPRWSPCGRRICNEGIALLPTCSPMRDLSVGHILQDACVVERIRRRKEALDIVRRLVGSGDRKQQGASTAKVTANKVSLLVI